ncbi:branched-chain amino acid ABC transporter permease [Pseudooceanicola sp. HF7]|uniref:branched-chain amino acid ABC transporter permease n=1 Tax=Pseudooceanicola sp. HF7 TaxID=2721560 RepID=UPI001431A3C9|nr:branched-chain amino acid ABC transporter permease [Pseudooceanicola sp. HF7]NIZ10593.1 branched-chain amino acid ABC transporter permease [Pseudooceanicola sp. HF7]
MIQAIADGLSTGAIIALGAMGVTLVMGILRFTNFAHAEYLTWGAYMALAVLSVTGLDAGQTGPFRFGLGLVLATVIAVVLTVALALAIDYLVFRRLRGRVNHITLVFASFGVALIVRYSIHLIFGGAAHYYSNDLQIAWLIGDGLRVMPDQALVFALALLVSVVLFLFLKYSALGLAMRGVAENPALAAINGVHFRKILFWTWAIGGGLAAVSGVFYGMTVQIRPDMGFQLLLPIFAAAILGGIGNVVGALFGGFIVALIEAIALLWIPAGYKIAVPFVVLLLVLWLCPRGLFKGSSGGSK